MDDFIDDITNRNLAAKVVAKTGWIETAVKYEMYFLLGVFSTVSITALAVITGTDITLSALSKYKEFVAAKKLAAVLLSEHSKTAAYAPTLHDKVEQYLLLQAKVKSKTYSRNLSSSVLNDEKVQAQLAGVLAGKAALSVKPFTYWTALFTILTAGIVGSITKSPETYMNTLYDRYEPLLNAIKKVNSGDHKALTDASRSIQSIISETGVSITLEESNAILNEVIQSPQKLKSSFENLSNAFREFNTVMAG